MAFNFFNLSEATAVARDAAELGLEPHVDNPDRLRLRGKVLPEAQDVGVVVGARGFGDTRAAGRDRPHPGGFIRHDADADAVAANQNAAAVRCCHFFSKLMGVVGVVVVGLVAARAEVLVGEAAAVKVLFELFFEPEAAVVGGEVEFFHSYVILPPLSRPLSHEGREECCENASSETPLPWWEREPRLYFCGRGGD